MLHYITNITPLHLIEVPVPNKESDRSCICLLGYLFCLFLHISIWGHRGHDSMVVGFTTTYAISAFHH